MPNLKITTAFILVVLFGLSVGCSKAQPSSDIHVASYGFTNEQVSSTGVESSLVAYNGNLKMLADPSENGTLALGEISNDVMTGATVESGNMRFSYVFAKNGTYYLFANRSGSIFAWTSSDLVNWSALNNGASVLDPMPNSVTATLWNVGVDIDDSGVFHLFAESSASDNSHACLTYFSASLNGSALDFNQSRPQACYIEMAGNPFVKFITGKGVLLVYGDEASSIWKTSAGIIALDGTFKKSSKFSIEASGIHICDPTMEELDGNLYLAVSVDQNSIHTMQKSGTFLDLFTAIENE